MCVCQCACVNGLYSGLCFNLWSMLDLFLRHLIGLRPTPQLNLVLDAFSDSDVAKLIYRDSINLKHGCRKRLASEIASKPALPSLRDNQMKEDENSKDLEPLSKALVAYLLEVVKRKWMESFLFDVRIGDICGKNCALISSFSPTGERQRFVSDILN